MYVLNFLLQCSWELLVFCQAKGRHILSPLATRNCCSSRFKSVVKYYALLWLGYYGLAGCLRHALVPTVYPWGCARFHVQISLARDASSIFVFMYTNSLRTTRNEHHTARAHCWLDETFLLLPCCVVIAALCRHSRSAKSAWAEHCDEHFVLCMLCGGG